VNAPVIGIATGIYNQGSEERISVSTSYLSAVETAGGVPLILPPGLDKRSTDGLFSRINGLLLIGGGDVDPARYGEKRHEKTGDVYPVRDEHEIGMVARAMAANRPIMAICRGIQVLNVALGGSLHQDLPSDPGGPIRHSQKEPGKQATHRIVLSPDAVRLFSILGAREIMVNSFHHQAVKRPGDGLQAVAHSDDGVIEAVESKDKDRFVLGVQWHPELMVTDDPHARALFSALVSSCRKSGTATDY